MPNHSTEGLLKILEHVPGVTARFDGDVWKAVEWAEDEQKKGLLKDLNLNAPMQVP